MKLTVKIFSVLLLLSFVHNTYAQTKRMQVAIFVPLYLDSAFDASLGYTYGKTFPRQSIAGLEFYTGAKAALDSMAMEGLTPRVYVFDTRSSTGNIPFVANSPVIDSIDLMIGAVSGTEYLQLASVAQVKNIPFVSATYPNDGGIKNNPFVLVASPKLNTHLQATYNYVMRNLGTSKIIYARSQNPGDNRIAETFKSLNQGTGGAVLKMEQLSLPSSVKEANLVKGLDSTRENVIIAGSLDENFGRSLATAALALSKTYSITLIGMPTWAGIRELRRSDFKSLPIIYSNSFFKGGDSWSQTFDLSYRRQTFSKPSDIAFKGYELTWYFTGLLNKYGRDFMSHLDDNAFNLCTDFDFRPIQWNRDSVGPDYYENKRVYLIKYLNNVATRVY